MKIETLNTLSEIASRDWMIMQSALPKLAAGIAKAPQPGQSLLDEIEFDDFFELRPPMSIGPDGIAMIHVHEALVDSCAPILEKVGIVTRYQTIEAEIDLAVESGAKGILLVMNSPGGTVRGNVETADKVAALPIPVVTFVSSMACSAAYKIAAGSKAIVASPSAIVGNIGTILSWPNLSEFWRMMGVEWKAITSEGAELKSTFHTEPNATQIAFLQEEIDAAGEQFRNHVQAGRTAAGASLDPEVFRAGWYSGGKAWGLGLIDATGDIITAKAILAAMIDTKEEDKSED